MFLVFMICKVLSDLVASLCLGIQLASLWNCSGDMTPILCKDIPSVVVYVVLMMVMKTLSNTLKSSKGVQLDLVIVKAIVYNLHHLHIHQTIHYIPPQPNSASHL